MGDRVATTYLVMCGATHAQLVEREDERAAIDAALAHDRRHHCTPWVQYPLEHVHRDDG